MPPGASRLFEPWGGGHLVPRQREGLAVFGIATVSGGIAECRHFFTSGVLPLRLVQ